MMRSEAADPPCDCRLCADNRRLWADIAAGRVPPRTWDGSAEVEGVDPLLEAASWPGEYGDRAADDYWNRVERAAEGVVR